MEDKQEKVNLLIKDKILEKTITAARSFQSIEKLNRGPYFQIKVEGLNRDIRFCNSPIILIDNEKKSEKECETFINENINTKKTCIIEDFIFTCQDYNRIKDHYNGISKMKINVDNQIIIIETDNKYNRFTKIM